MSWVRKTLGEICQVGGGRIQTGPFGSQLHESDYSTEGIPVVMPADIVEGKISTTRIARVSERHVERLRRHKLSKGDIVYGRRGDIGRQALITTENEGWLCGTGCLKISLGNARLNSEFLHRYLSTSAVIGWIEGQAVGATMPNLNTGILERIPVFYPEDQKTQDKIAAILSAYDDLIENNRRRIALLEKMAEEIYREWFVRLRFPGHEHKEVESYPLRYFVQKYGGGDWGEDMPSMGHPNTVFVIRGTDFDSVRAGNVSAVPRRYIKDSSLNSRRLQVGDVVIENSVNHQSRTAGKSLLITKHLLEQFDGDVICASFCKLIRPKGAKFSRFLSLNFRILFEQGLFEHFQNVATNGIANLQIERFLDRHKIQFHENINLDVFDAFDTSVLAQQQSKLLAMRDALLPRLISGKLAVEALDIRFPPSMEEHAHEY